MKYDVLSQMISQNPEAVGRIGLLVLVPLSDNDSCVKTLAATNTTIPAIMKGMQKGQDAAAVGAEICHRAFTKNQPMLVAQALQAGLVKYLLDLLNDNLTRTPSAAKAQVLRTLRSNYTAVVVAFLLYNTKIVVLNKH